MHVPVACGDKSNSDVCFFIWRDTEREGGREMMRVHSQLLMAEAPEGRFDRFSVNRLELCGALTCWGSAFAGVNEGHNIPRLTDQSQHRLIIYLGAGKRLKYRRKSNKITE